MDFRINISGKITITCYWNDLMLWYALTVYFERVCERKYILQLINRIAPFMLKLCNNDSRRFSTIYYTQYQMDVTESEVTSNNWQNEVRIRKQFHMFFSTLITCRMTYKKCTNNDSIDIDLQHANFPYTNHYNNIK